ncbi:MAG: phosphotransferase [Piscirickettsiaceae bacterium]|nr:phosphotransferase [Piscirickettsiaceae bacterium]
MTRLNEIHQWLEDVLSSADYQLDIASADASFRRYFRVTMQDKTWILMDAPPEKENTQPFITMATFLYQHNVHVPKIEAQNTQAGLLLLSDFGNKAYLDELNSDSANRLYSLAINSIIDIQRCPVDAIDLPHYDHDLLQQEMDLFPTWFLDKHLSIASPDFLQNTFDILINNALEQPQVIVHRDYHSRNLMHTAENSPGIIDFQDAVVGPISYDLVSLLRDCYISWSDQQLEQWINYYLSQAQQQGLLINISTARFTRWFDLMGLQRHIKVLGIFARLNYRDNKPNYMNDLPLTLNYVRQISAKYPEFHQLHKFLTHQTQIAAIQ